MKLLTSLLFLLISSTYGARLAIDVFPSSHKLQADGSAPDATNLAIGCLIPHLGRCGTCNDNTIKKQLKCVGNYDVSSTSTARKWTFTDCDCPSGSTCKEHDPLIGETQPTCRVAGREVHMGATEYDFEALNMVLQDTQIRPALSVTDSDLLAAFSTVANDRSGNGEDQKDKYPTYAVRIEGIDTRAYKSCSVTTLGAVAAAITTPLDVSTTDVYDSTNKVHKMIKNANRQSVECLFRPYNEAFLGMVVYNISFERDPVFLSPLEDPLLSVEMQIKFKPNPVDDAKWHLAGQLGDKKAIKYLFPDFNDESRDSEAENDDFAANLKADNGVFRFNSFSEVGFNNLTASALKGTLKLPVRGKFLDKRYLIVDESGTDVLVGGVGEAEMRKEGLEIHKDFDGFYDPTRDALDNLGLKLHPVKFIDRIANSVLNDELKDAAQFQMEHTYIMTYGGDYEGELAHFQPDYLACDICDAQIVFKAFPATGIHDTKVTGAAKETDFLLKYHVAVDPTMLPTSTNVITLNQINVEVVEEASGHRTYDEEYGSVSVSRKMALRLPSDKDPQNPDGFPLYQFLRPQISTLKKDYISLLSPYNFSMSALDFEFTGHDTGKCYDWGGSEDSTLTSSGKTDCIAAGKNWKAAKGLVKSDGCQNGKLYEIGTDIFGAAEKVFKENCKIQLVDYAFGQNMNITFGDKTAYLRQNDLRSVYAGATELSILRRKLDPSAVLMGNTVTFKVSKYGLTGPIKFKIKGTESMVGYANDGTLCTQAMIASSADTVKKGCIGLISAAEKNLTISANATSVEHSLRSSPACFRFFDIELHDYDNPWVIYQLRLPCNRITNTETEALNLTYSFSSAYDLFTDRFTGTIGYDIPTGMGLSIAVDATDKKQYGFGSCAKQSGVDVISRPSTCVDDSDGGTAKTVTGWGDGSKIDTVGTGSLSIDTSNAVTLEALRDCDVLSTDTEYIDDSGEQYIMKHSLALIYTRTDPDNAGRSDVKYCQDQQFITSIRRDATASVTVGTLVDKSLERSVMVTSMDWIQCSKDRVECKQSDDCYKLRIELDSRDQDKSSGVWSDTLLTNVEISSISTNTDSLTLDITGVNVTGGPNGYKNEFALESACGVVNDCDKGTGSHYDKLIEQETHFVVTGFFDNIESTSNVEVETKFESCPLLNNTEMDGDVLRLGMQISCVSEAGMNKSDVQTSGGDLQNVTVASKRATYLDCTQAEATAYARIATEVAVSQEANKDSDPIAVADFTAANTNGWKIQNITYIIHRYEALLDGTKDVTRKVSSTPILRFGRGNSTGEGGDDELYECEKLASRIPELPLFDEAVMDCDNDFTRTKNSISIDTSFLKHKDITLIYFDLLPLLDANLDVFEVEADALLFNTKIDASINPTRRRLRSAKYTYELPRLNSDDEIVGSTNGFRVLAPSKDISDEALPAAPSDAPVSDSGKADSTSSGEADVDTWLIVIIVIGVVAIAAVLLLVNKDKMCPMGGAVDTASTASTEEVANLLVGNRQTRFSNLRY